MNPVVIVLLLVLLPSFLLYIVLALKSKVKLHYGLAGGSAALTLYTVLNLEPIELALGKVSANLSSLMKDLLILFFVASISWSWSTLHSRFHQRRIMAVVLAVLVPLAVLRSIVWTRAAVGFSSLTGYDFDVFAFHRSDYATVEVISALVLLFCSANQFLLLRHQVSQVIATRTACVVMMVSMLFLALWSVSLMCSVTKIWVTGTQLGPNFHVARSGTSVIGSVAYGLGCLLFPLQAWIDRRRWRRASELICELLRDELDRINSLPGGFSQDEVLDAIVLRGRDRGVEFLYGDRGSEEDLAELLSCGTTTLMMPHISQRRAVRTWIMGAGRLLKHAHGKNR